MRAQVKTKAAAGQLALHTYLMSCVAHDSCNDCCEQLCAKRCWCAPVTDATAAWPHAVNLCLPSSMPPEQWQRCDTVACGIVTQRTLVAICALDREATWKYDGTSSWGYLKCQDVFQGNPWDLQEPSPMLLTRDHAVRMIFILPLYLLGLRFASCEHLHDLTQKQNSLQFTQNHCID